MADPTSDQNPMLWKGLSGDVQEALAGKLSGLWGAASDEDAFNGCVVDKQQTLLLMTSRLQAKDLWQQIQKIINVWGEHGVGIDFSPADGVEAMFRARKISRALWQTTKTQPADFTKRGAGTLFCISFT